MEIEVFNHFESSGILEGLHPLQIEKFKICCRKAVDENPGFNFDDMLIVCRIYLSLIIEYPTINL